MNPRDKLTYLTIKQSKDPEHLDKFHENRNKLNKIFNRTEVAYFHYQIINNKKYCSKICKIIKQITNDKKSPANSISIMNNFDEIIIIHKIIIDLFNKYFSEVGLNIANNIT